MIGRDLSISEAALLVAVILFFIALIALIIWPGHDDD